MSPHRNSPITRLGGVAPLALAAWLPALQAAEPPAVELPPAAPQVQPPAADASRPQPTCVWACLSWGRRCNVDPRGVYKCQRTCEKFGQQCE